MANNAPSGSNYWFGFTAHQQGTGSENAYYVQIAFSTGGNIIAARYYTKSNNSWSAWKETELT